MAPKNNLLSAEDVTTSRINNKHNKDSTMASTWDGSTSSSSPRPPTLREEAALRAEQVLASQQQQHYYYPSSPEDWIEPTTTVSTMSSPTHESFPFPNTPHTPNTIMSHPLAAATGATETTSSSTENLVQSARKEWRRHGAGLTQTLEEKRRQDESRPGTLTVRVLSAETRRDVSGAKFTAYILRVQHANGQVLELEHRYSEFAKLNDIFKTHSIPIVECAFPTKHWAGRIGNWTPSLQWAPNQHEDLIHFRKVQLDVWLVHVVEKYNLGELPHRVHEAVYEFLTQSDRPPCDQENTTYYSSRQDDWTKWNNPLSFTMGSTIRQATVTVEHMCHNHTDDSPPNNTAGTKSSVLNDTDQAIPLDLLQCAKGLCFLTVFKAGLVVSGRVGTGLLIARLDEDRWSAPCALGTIGLGWGMLAGGDITHYLVVLTTTEAVEALLSGTVQLGAELGVAVGPVGRGATSQVVAGGGGDWAVHSAYSYAHSQGLFFGMSLEGSVLTTRQDVNSKFYGQHYSPASRILDLPPPKAAEPLYNALAKAMKKEIPENGFRPSQLFQEYSTYNNSKIPARQTPSPNHRTVHSPGEQPPVDGSGRVTLHAVSSMGSPI